MNYTKGNWEVVEEPQGINQLPRTDIMAFADGGFEKNICQLSVRSPEEEKTNARLISAAPDMYEALLALLEEYQITKTDDEINVSSNWIRARESVSKSEGKQ